MAINVRTIRKYFNERSTSCRTSRTKGDIQFTNLILKGAMNKSKTSANTYFTQTARVSTDSRKIFYKYYLHYRTESR